MPFQGNGWTPNTITRAVRGLTTATRTALVDTELGEGYLKALGNPEGPHSLACELIGSLCAAWLGMRTFDFSIIEVTSPTEVEIDGQSWARPGPAFISRAESMGFTWGGDSQTLSGVSNREDISKLIVLDSWLRNCDRYSPDGRRINLKNVFLIQRTNPQRILELMAMDFTHAFTCGSPLDRRLGHIDRIRDESVYGRFPEFEAHLSREQVVECAGKLESFDMAIAKEFVDLLPREWQVDAAACSALKKFLVERARFTATTITRRLWPVTEEIPFQGGI